MYMYIHVSIKLASHDCVSHKFLFKQQSLCKGMVMRKSVNLPRSMSAVLKLFLHNIFCHQVSQNTECFSWEHYMKSQRLVHVRCGGWLLCEYYTSSVIRMSKIYFKQTYLKFSFTRNNITSKISWKTWQNLWYIPCELLIYVIH